MPWLGIVMWLITNEPTLVKDVSALISAIKGQPTFLEEIRTVFSEVISVLEAAKKL
jgi:hypothetical protein